MALMQSRAVQHAVGSCAPLIAPHAKTTTIGSGAPRNGSNNNQMHVFSGSRRALLGLAALALSNMFSPKARPPCAVPLSRYGGQFGFLRFPPGSLLAYRE